MKTHSRSFKLVEISKYIARDRVIDLISATKKDVLAEMVQILSKSLSGKVDPDAVLKAIMAREAKISTGVGIGIALPHARMRDVDAFAIAVGRSQKGIAYNSFDGKPVHLVFMILSPKEECCLYLNVHAKIALMMSDNGLRERLVKARDIDEVYQAFKGK